MEKLRVELYRAINEFGLNHKKVFEADKKIQDEIVKHQRAMARG